MVKLQDYRTIQVKYCDLNFLCILMNNNNYNIIILCNYYVVFIYLKHLIFKKKGTGRFRGSPALPC